MNGTFRQSMSWLHTWAGLTLGSLLFFMFITGSAGYFEEEITQWMQPELEQLAIPSEVKMLHVAQARLTQVASNAKSWWIDFPRGRESSLRIWWEELPNQGKNTKAESEWKQEVLNPNTGLPMEIRETAGGRALYIMHYTLHYIPRTLGFWITSLAAMFMLVALITGVVIHRRIFKDFFTFRPGKKQRSWLDMHNVLSVFPLPFHLMITYSGLVFLIFTTMPGTIAVNYGIEKADYSKFFDEAFQKAEHPEKSNIKISGVHITSLLPDIQARWGKEQIANIGIKERGTEGAHIEVSRTGYTGLHDKGELIYHGVSGELLNDSMMKNNEPLASKKIYDVLTHLHEGLFASTLLRWLYFLSGLMGAGMIATGMILWAVKRRERAQRREEKSASLVFVERLNAGSLLGLVISIAVYFWANRLIPAELEGRDHWEINSLFISWAILLVCPFLLARKYSTHELWTRLLALAAVLYGLLPVLNGLTSSNHLANTLLNSNWVMAGFDLSMLVFSAGFSCAAYKMYRKSLTIPADSTSLTPVVEL